MHDLLLHFWASFGRPLLLTWLDEREYGMKEQEIANAALREAITLQRDADLISAIKRYGATLKYVLPRMPSESAELPAYFDTVEKNLPCTRSQTTSKPSWYCRCCHSGRSPWSVVWLPRRWTIITNWKGSYWRSSNWRRESIRLVL